MFYKMPKNVKARLEELKDASTLDEMFERTVLRRVAILEANGYEVSTELLYVEENTYDKENTSIKLNDNFIGCANTLFELETCLSIAVETIYTVFKNEKKSFMYEVA